MINLPVNSDTQHDQQLIQFPPAPAACQQNQTQHNDRKFADHDVPPSLLRFLSLLLPKLAAAPGCLYFTHLGMRNRVSSISLDRSGANGPM
ncbi:hypothetical protein D3C73_1473160 [compost metagenome]